MTKQEKIQEAYGEHWEIVKNEVDENGWIDLSFAVRANIGEIGSKTYQFQGLERNHKGCRILSLCSLEENNGWIKIESESDLPKEDCRCEFIKDTGTQFYGRFENRMGGLFVDESRRFEHPETRTESVTHWKLILTSVKPIY